MAEDSINITYETLYEILRNEKNKEELCELDEEFYKNTLEYLKEKTKIFEEASQKNDIFSMDEKDNTQLQIQNIKKIIKEIYERREKKIINIALNKSRTNSDIIDTSNLLNTEKNFFETLTKLLDKFRIGILAQVLQLKLPNPGMENTNKPQENQQAKQEPAKDKNRLKPTETNIAEQKPEQAPGKPENKAEQAPQPAKAAKKIKITISVDQFVGPELDLYGPYKEGETIEIPEEIAKILLAKGSAEETH